MGRILAIDYGTKRTGIAVSDPLRIIAGGVDTVPTHTLLQWVRDYVAKNNVDIIVVGKPTQMNGQESQSFVHIKPFAEKLQREFPSLEVVFHDERFTSVMAQRAIIEGGVPKQQRRENKGLVDKVSAVIILQGYMESSIKQF